MNSAKGNVLIIDDEDKLRSLLSRIIGLEGYSVVEARDGKDGLKKLEREDIQVIITDVRLPDANGVELTQKIKSLYPYIEIIVLTAYGTISDGVKAIKNGAFDYITKGDDNDKIIPLLARAMDKAQLQKRLLQLEKKLSQKYSFETIVGESAQIRDTIELAKKIAGTDSTVLITGETGTGKEVFAQAIHYSGKRQNKNFLAVNCAALGKDLLESELFGHKAGAYTGAIKDTKGLFEEADGGTIFLDEIGEMSYELQSKLLRVLETNEFLKVGDSKPTKVDVRVIAATNRNLQQESDSGKFRTDLFYRLAVFQLALPALRERPKDIKPLAEHFIAVFAGKVSKRIPEMTKPFIEKLTQYQWRGNIRELKNIIERTVLLSDNVQLTVEDLPFEIRNISNSNLPGSSYALSEVEKNHILRVLDSTKGNKTETARLLDIGLTTLYRKLEEYNI